MRTALLACGLIVTASFAMAQSRDLGAEREATMKEVGRAFGQVNRMNRGQAEFDGAAASEAFRTMSSRAKMFAGLFPDDSRTAEGSPGVKSSPAIWQNKADFETRLVKFSTDAEAATGQTGDEDSFKAAFKVVAANCSSCHELYRIDDKR
ncbi:c-type cytochrome [Terrihabitans sp. B22-R8]|uniref:c-type cytochrome n=1 Tax=Terrihabitans sp. B22-R8 TaxID=3425128 RepID=UPI00403C283C